MKILYFSNSRIPTEMAYGIQIMKTCEALVKAGANLELILPTRKNKLFKNINSFDYYQVEKNFKIKKILSYDPDWLMSLRDGIYIKFQLTFFIASLFFYLIPRRGRLRKQNSKNIFYTRDEYLLRLLQKFSKNVVWEAHTLPKNKSKYLKTWQKCQKIITISQGLKDELVKLGLNENKILVAHDGVDMANFQFPRLRQGYGGQAIFNFQELRQKLDLPKNKKIILYTGHLYDWKGVNVLLNAARNFQFPNNNFQFVFIGGTEMDIKNFKEKAKNIKNVSILGYKAPTQIPVYLKSADVLILPNSAKDEQSKWTSPLKLFEYMASKKPIVASDLPSIKEILNANNSVLVKPDNPQELVNGIKKILSNPELAEKISTQAQKDVQNHTWQKRAEKIYNFIKINL